MVPLDTTNHSEDDVQSHTRVFDIDLSNASASKIYLGYILPNINEMVSSKDGYVMNPVHLAMCLGLGKWSHLSGLACGADAMRMFVFQYRRLAMLGQQWEVQSYGDVKIRCGGVE